MALFRLDDDAPIAVLSDNSVANQIAGQGADAGTDHGGAEPRKTSIGIKGQVGPINSPTVLNSSYNFVQFWDGRASDLADQAKGPVQRSVEMNNTPARIVSTLRSMPEYVALFQKAFHFLQKLISDIGNYQIFCVWFWLTDT